MIRGGRVTAGTARLGLKKANSGYWEDDLEKIEDEPKSFTEQKIVIILKTDEISYLREY